MICFHDHVINRRSGRPEPHVSWLAERFVTWTGWAMAAISIAGAAFYYEQWGELDGAMSMLAGAVLFSLIAYARRKALERKALELSKAVAAYEALLANAHRGGSRSSPH
jgi:hypothetical protein